MKNKIVPFSSLVVITILTSSCQTMSDRVDDRSVGMVNDEWDFYRQATTIQTSTDNSILIISYKPNEKEMALQTIIALNGKIIYDYKNFNSFAASFDTKNIDTIKEKIQRNPSVLGVERNHISYVTTNF